METALVPPTIYSVCYCTMIPNANSHFSGLALWPSLIGRVFHIDLGGFVEDVNGLSGGQIDDCAPGAAMGSKRTGGKDFPGL